jgi:hypothetical protein
MLSVYFDGEMPSPWKEKMEAHVSACPDCRKRLETYRFISQTNAPSDVPEGASERIWQRLAFSDGDSGREQAPLPVIRRRPLWRRRVSVPLPAAAAAAVLVLVFAFVLFRNTPAADSAPAIALTPETETGAFPVIATEAEFGMPEIYPDLDMASVLQYLNDRDSGDVLIIRLPESRKFLNYSEPAIIKAADYSPNVQGGRRH